MNPAETYVRVPWLGPCQVHCDVVAHQREVVGEQVLVPELAVAQQVIVGVAHHHRRLEPFEAIERITHQPQHADALLASQLIEIRVVDLGEPKQADAVVEALPLVEVRHRAFESVPETGAERAGIVRDVDLVLLVAEHVAERDLRRGARAAGGIDDHRVLHQVEAEVALVGLRRVEVLVRVQRRHPRPRAVGLRRPANRDETQRVGLERDALLRGEQQPVPVRQPVGIARRPDQPGDPPRLAEAAANGRTHRSLVPPRVDRKAIHRPSGETTGWRSSPEGASLSRCGSPPSSDRRNRS